MPVDQNILPAYLERVNGNSPFAKFVLHQHRWMLVTIGIVLVLEFAGYKILYPHAVLTPDSFYYINAAARDLSINYWPIGYSKALQLLHAFGHSDWIVVLVQYLCLEGAVLFLYFTILYFLPLGKWASWILLILVTLNPILPIISNYVLSDSLFTALTICWFASMIWLIFKPGAWMAYLSVIAVFLSYTIRYYAIFYPAFTLVILLLSGVNWRTRIISIGLGAALFIGFIEYTSGEYGRLLGRRAFSPFSGWRLAENALIMYQEIAPGAADTPPAPLKPLHAFITHALDSIRQSGIEDGPRVYYNVKDRTDLFISYMRWHYRNDTITDYFTQWASMGNLYDRYGAFLIKRHPMEYARYYAGKGVRWYMLPIQEITNEFEYGNYWVTPQARQWFGFHSTVLTCTTSKVFSMRPFPYIMFVFNGLMVLCTTGFLLLGTYKRACNGVKKAVAVAAGFWLVNFIFNVIASPVMMRYGIPVLILNIIFSLVLVDQILRE